jgi:hypothetical protein
LWVDKGILFIFYLNECGKGHKIIYSKELVVGTI